MTQELQQIIEQVEKISGGRAVFEGTGRNQAALVKDAAGRMVDGTYVSGTSRLDVATKLLAKVAPAPKPARTSTVTTGLSEPVVVLRDGYHFRRLLKGSRLHVTRDGATMAECRQMLHERESHDDVVRVRVESQICSRCLSKSLNYAVHEYTGTSVREIESVMRFFAAEPAALTTTIERRGPAGDLWQIVVYTNSMRRRLFAPEQEADAALWAEQQAVTIAKTRQASKLTLAECVAQGQHATLIAANVFHTHRDDVIDPADGNPQPRPSYTKPVVIHATDRSTYVDRPLDAIVYGAFGGDTYVLLGVDRGLASGMKPIGLTKKQALELAQALTAAADVVNDVTFENPTVRTVARSEIETRWPSDRAGAAHFVDGKEVQIITLGNETATVRAAR